MTLPEFLEKLAQSGGNWKVEGDSCIRCNGMCPIEHVTGRKGAFSSASLIGLTEADATAIVCAADGWGRTRQGLRQQLLDATVGRVS